MFRTASLFPVDFASIQLQPGDNIPQKAAAFVAELSDEDALAQTLMFGWSGAPPSPYLLEWIQKRGIGGVKVFGWNTPLPDNPTAADQLQTTITLAETIGVYQKSALARPLKIPLLVATDQEGGIIRHVKGVTSLTPGNMALGASGRPRDAYLQGYYLGREMAALGINMNFAPTVDVLTDTRSTLIGTRAFGDNPVYAGILGAAYAQGLHDAGVIATAKHFPGHGDTALDSHGVLPRIDVEMDVLWERELVPYRILAKEGVGAIMSGHIAFPKTHAGNRPASLSRYFLTDILRDEIGYKGLVVTDDISMNGATFAAGSQWRAAFEALDAGNDLIMSSGNPALDGPLWGNLLAEMRRSESFNKRVREAATRVIVAKLEYLKGPNAPPFIPDTREIRDRIPDAGAADFYRDLASRAATIIIEKESGVFPLTPETAGNVLLTGPDLEFFSVGKKAFPNAKSIWAAPEFRSDFLAMAQNADTIIFCLRDAQGSALLRAARYLGKKIFVLSVLNPAYLEGLDWIDGAVAVYSDYAESFLAGFSAITGHIEAEGKLPLKLDLN
ncbi:MAG: glycoside hydrolase family 3 protein [Spirochaetaceae bacterium]|nr:glycoside hydrolase family 3 protein [Spirochaetaceae bacterium]